jgi:hypothetical protein
LRNDAGANRLKESEKEMKQQQNLRMTTVDITEAAKVAGCDAELEMKYMEYETLQVEAVTSRRAAAEAATEAIIAEQRAAQAFIRFLRYSGEIADVVKREPVWMPPFRGRDGDIVLQSPMTRKDARVAANLAHKEMTRHADQEDLGDMFGSEDEE